MEGPSPRSERKEVSDGSEVIYDTRKNLMYLGNEMMATCLHRSSVVKKGNHSMKNDTIRRRANLGSPLWRRRRNSSCSSPEKAGCFEWCANIMCRFEKLSTA